MQSLLDLLDIKFYKPQANQPTESVAQLIELAKIYECTTPNEYGTYNPSF